MATTQPGAPLRAASAAAGPRATGEPAGGRGRGCLQGAARPTWCGQLRRAGRLSLAALAVVVLVPQSALARDSDGDGLRDRFEHRWGVTDPGRRDSDGDGVIDAAEDADGDRLGNLAEQRLGTNPGARDSDGDGVNDGAEDADGNGLSNAREQDRRPLPPRVRPSLGGAYGDRPGSYANGCHSSAYDASIHPCVYGDRSARTRVALFGDSHALQWLPALVRAGARTGWRVVTITKSACPSVHVRFQEPVFRNASASCRRWRIRAEEWLARHPQHLVIIANSGRYPVIDGRGRRLGPRRREVRWGKGLARTIRAMPARSRVLVLADTPHLKIDPPRCLRLNPKRMSACVTRRSAAIRRRHDRAERGTAVAAGAAFAHLHGQVCSYDPCPVVIGRVLLWRDRSHLTATFVRQLAPSMRDLVRDQLDARG